MADTYSSGAINFTGLGNGTDFSKIVEGLVDVEKNRVRRLEKWKSSWETKNAQFKDLNTKMLSLKSQLESINTLNKFLSKSVSTSDSTKLTATATSDAMEATHTIQINQLATNDVHITTSGASSLDSSITSSTTNFTFSYAGENHTISNISAGTTLQGFVNLINNHADSRSHIRATTIFDGSVYHLQLSGLDQGSGNQLEISDAGSIIFGASDFTETQNAVSSQIRINGFPASDAGWIERDSNSIDDVIEGMTLNLQEADPNSIHQLTVVTNTAGIKENIVKFVDQVNIVRAQIKAITDVDDEGNGSILTGNYGVDIIGQNIKNITAGMGKGFVNWDPDTLTGDKYTALSQIGILTDAEKGSTSFGLLRIDEKELDKALKENPTAIAELFATTAQGKSQSPDFTFQSLIDGYTKAGVYDIEIVSDGSGITSATINGEEAKISGWEITGLKGNATGMSIRLDNRGAGTYSGQVSIKQGKTGEMIDELRELTKPFNEFNYEGGPLAVLQSNYKDIMDSIDQKIEFENKRIERMERNLKLRFSRLDALLGQYELRQGQLSSAIGQLDQ